ncbi:TonB-dependent receptor domain-containing protein [Pseudoxanthomonas winnipegensis]|uniref:TonB-dependent receptor domain-containing protein n=1 Tax=Pseudoxanthomonas winnipegensis TaxID=2480810 RepID=UPI0013EE8A80|nr:TonB-dependent receptor [Pseudoxanthomonas winnipegensis]
MNTITLSALAIAVSLCLASAAHAQTADTDETQASNPSTQQVQPRQLDGVSVTGSLLPRSQLETFVPTVTITHQDMVRQGFKDVATALRASTLGGGGLREGAPIGSGNTQATRSVNLFGLGASYTKILINGHPFANFPMAANTTDGGMLADLSNIPMAMIDRIEILPGSQSATYGADAVAGVVNILLRRDVQGTEISVQSNVYTEGGGASQRLQLVGGSALGSATSLTYALQYDHAAPLLGTERRLTAYTPAKDDAFARTSATSYYDPGAQGCAQMADLFGGTMEYKTNGAARYCGSDNTAASVSTYDAARRTVAGYLSLQHDVSERMTAYADLNYALGQTQSNCCLTWYWQNVTDQASGKNYLISREFALEEIGGFGNAARRNRTHQYDFTGGLRGDLGDGDWRYDAYYSRSAYAVKQHQLQPVTPTMNAYLAQRYRDVRQVFVPLTPQEYLGFSYDQTRKADTMTQQVSARVYNSRLFGLPGGDAGLAILLEGGNERWNDSPDAMSRSGAMFGGATQASHGDRDRWGGAVQMDLPVASMLTATLAGRYDDYRYSGYDRNRPTWRLGLEFRPFESLLLRGGLGTSFRAPDMSFLYSGASKGNQNTYDFYRCDQLGVSRSSTQCRYIMPSYTSGNLALEPVSSKSKSIGLVWAPLRNLTFNADFMDIEIHNEVRALSLANILFDEAACRQNGQASYLPSCADALARVSRGADGLITGVQSGYFNVAYKQMKLLMGGANYRLATERLGSWNFKLNASRIVDYRAQLDSVSPIVDVIDEPKGQASFFPRMLNATIGWEQGPLSVTLWGVRYGKTPNFSVRTWGWSPTAAQVALYGPPGYDDAWLLFNGSVQYQLPFQATLSLAVTNLANRMPPNRNWTSAPYFNSQLYNVYGRGLSFEVTKKF